MNALAAFTLAVLAGAPRTDTTVTVAPGTRLALSNFAGSIAVRTWSRNAVRVAAEHSSRVAIEIDAEGPVLSVRASYWRHVHGPVSYQLTVPKWMGLELSGMNTDISVVDSQGEIQAESIQGRVEVAGGSKTVKVSSVTGEVRVQGATGKIECSSVNAAVHVESARGQVVASSINGEIVLQAIESDDVDASTVNGQVSYAGAIRKGGCYRFASHNGELLVTVPERTGAAVSVATINGEFISEFPVQITETRRGKRFNFTLGDGSARIELESFNGAIRLRRPGRVAEADGKQR